MSNNEIDFIDFSEANLSEWLTCSTGETFILR